MGQRLELLHWIEKLNTARLLVLGDVMLDRFIYGDVSRISPEGPVPVLRSTEMKSVLGGAGNVVRNLASLGSRVHFVSTVGSDTPADQIRDLLSQLPLVESCLITDPSRESTVKTRFLSKQQQLLRVDSETARPIGETVLQKAVEAVRGYLPLCDVAVISDYGKGFMSQEFLKALLPLCRENGVPVLVDPKGPDYSIYRNASILTPNLKELGEATKMMVADDESVVLAAQKLIEECSVEAVLATRSQDGLSLVEGSGRVTHLRSEAKEVFDVTGAGDTVIAVMGAALASGVPLVQCAEIANLAAGIVVGKAGTAVIYANDLIRAVRQQEFSTAESKILDQVAAAEQVEMWRRRGYSIGLMNGFFELLHPAHVRLLSQASKMCDRLIVGINGDDSILRIKGEHPILHEAARSAIIASLEDVDMVVIFQEDTPAQLIELLKPDLLIKRTVPSDAGTIEKDAPDSDRQVLLIDVQEERERTITGRVQ
ncbi:MAG: D-glycero-beta-D-manno-heptose-7-phosphate kinase [Acidobacteria bacterium]|nr:D-glycero-beta-D-manno-heptose-7-phosphate kinase [Acidobacteriota bacterium]